MLDVFKYLICGAGHIGPAIVHHLIESKNTHQVYVVDGDEAKLRSLKNTFSEHQNLDKIKTVCALSSSDVVLNLSRCVDIIIAAMPWKATFNLIKETRKIDVPLISITRPCYTDMSQLKELVTKNKSSVLIGCGLEPGLTEILSCHFSSFFPDLTQLHIYCGGLVTPQNEPLFYKQVFGHDLPLSEKTSFCVKCAELREVKRFSELEHITLKNIGRLEAWHDGMLPWLPESLGLSQLSGINQKTLRWPGFLNTISVLRNLGFLKTSAITVNDQEVIPYNVAQEILRSHAQFDGTNDRDHVVLHLRGLIHDKEVFQVTLHDQYDDTFHLSAMARTTGYVAAITAQIMLETNSNGYLYPEKFFMDNAKYRCLTEQLQNHRITILEKYSKLEK